MENNRRKLNRAYFYGESIVSPVLNLNELVNDDLSAAKMFCFVCRITEILAMAHDTGCKWDYNVHREYTKEMQPTGECTINIKIGTIGSSKQPITQPTPSPQSEEQPTLAAAAG
jgi:hypothetical protein